MPHVEGVLTAGKQRAPRMLAHAKTTCTLRVALFASLSYLSSVACRRVRPPLRFFMQAIICVFGISACLTPHLCAHTHSPFNVYVQLQIVNACAIHNRCVWHTAATSQRQRLKNTSERIDYDADGDRHIQRTDSKRRGARACATFVRFVEAQEYAACVCCVNVIRYHSARPVVAIAIVVCDCACSRSRSVARIRTSYTRIRPLRILCHFSLYRGIFMCRSVIDAFAICRLVADAARDIAAIVCAHRRVSSYTFCVCSQ